MNSQQFNRFRNPLVPLGFIEALADMDRHTSDMKAFLNGRWFSDIRERNRQMAERFEKASHTVRESLR